MRCPFSAYLGSSGWTGASRWEHWPKDGADACLLSAAARTSRTSSTRSWLAESSSADCARSRTSSAPEAKNTAPQANSAHSRHPVRRSLIFFIIKPPSAG